MHPKWEFIGGSDDNTADAISRATPPSPPPTTNNNCALSLQDHQPTINSITTSLQHHQYVALKRHQSLDMELKLFITKQHSTLPSVELQVINNLFCMVTRKHIHISMCHTLYGTRCCTIYTTQHILVCAQLFMKQLAFITGPT